MEKHIDKKIAENESGIERLQAENVRLVAQKKRMQGKAGSRNGGATILKAQAG